MEAERKGLQRVAASLETKASEAERKRQQRLAASPSTKAMEAGRKKQQRVAASPDTKARKAGRKRQAARNAQQRLSPQVGPSTDNRNTPSTSNGNNTPRQHSAPRILRTAATNYFQKHFVQNPFGAVCSV
ncbi:hypothetical protein MTO96_030601 [Rhipicephalus appendiculatus]